MNSYFLMIVLALLVVLTAVVAYNIYQENQYRKKIRSQFGHADQDVLMDVKNASVRDGQVFGQDGVRPLKAALVAEQSEKNTAESELQKNNDKFEMPQTVPEPAVVNEKSVHKHLVFREPVIEEVTQKIESAEPIQDAPLPAKSDITFELIAPQEQSDANADKTEDVNDDACEPELSLKTGEGDDLLSELARNDLSWFDKRFDFMAYVVLNEPCELQAIPRLAVRQRFQIVGCTRDGRFQAAEPIPGVLYQAFVIGLQGVSRSGLVDMAELNYFSAQVRQFAENMGGCAKVGDAAAFLARAAELDEVCARVDQTIAIHLVSRASVQGVELRQALENYGFALQDNGAFVYFDAQGNALYSVVALDGSEFTDALLANQPYKGFSMLFDVTRVPSGERDFNGFMSLAVKLSSDLSLELVDEQIQPLSTEWLKEVRAYVGILQQEMEDINVAPGSVLAKRLFA